MSYPASCRLFLLRLQVERRPQTAVHIKRHRSVLVHNPPAGSVALETNRLAHPEANRLLDSLLVAGHPHITMTERDVARNRDLEIMRLNPDRPVPRIQPLLRFRNVDAMMHERRSKTKNGRIRRI